MKGRKRKHNGWLAMLPGEARIGVERPNETRSQRYRRKHREEINARSRAKHAKNRDKINARKRERYAQGKGRAA